MREIMQVEVSAESVSQIVESIFATMMDLNVVQTEMPWHSAGDRVTASVFLDGEWNGAVSFECNHDQACLFAGQLLSTDPPEVMDDSVRDVLGELANMIGGNVKSAMAPGARLSMPVVVDGSQYGLRICGAEVQERLAFSFAGGPFWVTVAVKSA
jgi:chemotaxis protein CheX